MQPLLWEIFKQPPFILYRKGKSLRDQYLWEQNYNKKPLFTPLYHLLMSRVWPVNTLFYLSILYITPTSQVEVKCPRDPGAAIAITPPRRQNTRLPCPNPQPSHEPPVPGPQPRAPVILKPKWLSGGEGKLHNKSETGEGGNGTLRTLLQTKHATPIK